MDASNEQKPTKNHGDHFVGEVKVLVVVASLMAVSSTIFRDVAMSVVAGSFFVLIGLLCIAEAICHKDKD